jgi:hypothetical protein
MTYVIDNNKDDKTLTVTFDPALTNPVLPNKSWATLELHQPTLAALMVQEKGSKDNIYEGFMKFIVELTKQTNYEWPEQMVKKLPMEVLEEIGNFTASFRKPM